jgi:hypothetical protein
MATTFAHGPGLLAGPGTDPVGSDSSKAWRAGISGQVKSLIRQAERQRWLLIETPRR